MTPPFRVHVERDVRALPLDSPMGLDPLLDDPAIEVTFLHPDSDAAMAPSDLQGADAFVSMENPITRESLDGVSELDLVARMGAGYDNLDLDALTERGIVAVHAPQGPTESVAQATVAMLIVCAQNLRRYDGAVRESGFAERNAHWGFELGNATVGIVGAGRIGSRVVELLAPLDPDVQVYDPYVDDERLDGLGVRRASLGELLETSELVSLHVPLTEETRGMFGTAQFERMQDSAYLVNTTRGGVCSDEALANALRSGELAGAAVDVFEDEPDVEANPLLDCENCLLTPHVAGLTRDSVERIGNIVAASVQQVAAGDYPDNILNPGVYDEPVPADQLSPSFN